MKRTALVLAAMLLASAFLCSCASKAPDAKVRDEIREERKQKDEANAQ